MEGRKEGRKEGKAGLRIAYSNQKFIKKMINVSLYIKKVHFDHIVVIYIENGNFLGDMDFKLKMGVI